MNEERFNYFIQICRWGSITKAAEHLYISQPALSKYVSNLERDLGPLIDRNVNPLKLTPAGEIYLAYARYMYEKYLNMKSSIETCQNLNKNLLSIGIAPNISQYYFNDMIKIALEVDSTFDFKVTEDKSINMESYVEQGKIDIALMFTDSCDYEKMAYTKIIDDRIYLVCGKDNPVLKGRKKIWIDGKEQYQLWCEEIGALKFYSRDKSYKLTETVDKYIARKKIELKDNVTVSDIHTMYYLMKDTDRFCFLPEFFLEENNMFEDVALCSMDGEQLKWHMVLIRRKDKILSPQVLEWIDRVKAFYRQR